MCDPRRVVSAATFPARGRMVLSALAAGGIGPEPPEHVRTYRLHHDGEGAP